MKELYEELRLEIIRFDAADIITASDAAETTAKEDTAAKDEISTKEEAPAKEETATKDDATESKSDTGNDTDTKDDTDDNTVDNTGNDTEPVTGTEVSSYFDGVETSHILTPTERIEEYPEYNAYLDENGTIWLECDDSYDTPEWHILHG